jgi:hypothetical protein
LVGRKTFIEKRGYGIGTASDILEQGICPSFQKYSLHKRRSSAMSTADSICQAIREQKMLEFFYDGGTHVVEPHQLAYNERNNLALGAYWVRGYSKSGETSNRWREYLVEEMSSIVILSEHFDGPRRGYKRTPNRKYHSAVCEL